MDQNQTPPIGIVIPTFNRSTLLKQCLASLVRQDLPKELLQIHISDNASTDDTAQIAESFKQALNIKYHRQQENIGHVANYNWLFNNCRNKYILTLCDDDWLADGYLGRAYRFLESNPEVVCYSAAAAYHDDQSGQVINVMRPILFDASSTGEHPDVLWQRDAFMAMCAVETPVFFGTALMRNELFRAAMQEDMSFYYSKEKIYFAKLLRFGTVYTEAAIGAHVRWHDNNITKSFEQTESTREFRESTQRVLELGFEQGIDIPDFWCRKLAVASQRERDLIVDKMSSGFTRDEISAMLNGHNKIFEAIRERFLNREQPVAQLPQQEHTLAIFTPNLGAISETFIRQHIQLLAPSRTVVITGNVFDASWVEVPVLVIPFTAEAFARYAPEVENTVCSFLRQHNVTHILCEFACFGTEIVELNYRKLGLPIYVHFFGGDASEWLTFPNMADYYRWMGQAVTGVVTIAVPMTKRLVGIGIPEHKIHCIHLGIPEDVPVLATPGEQPCRFVSVTRMVPKKGIPYLIQAFKRVHDVLPDSTLDIIGGDNSTPGQPGPIRQLIEGLIEQLRLGDSVRLHGGQQMDYVSECFGRSSVYVQHSITDPETGDTEGLPVAILQASAAGLPVVSTLHEGIPEEVEHGVTGFLVEEFNVTAMAAYMILLAKDPVLRETMGSAARAKIKAEFNVTRSIPQLRRLIGLDQAVEVPPVRPSHAKHAVESVRSETPSILFINTYYDAFWQEQYRRQPTLCSASYAVQKAALQATCFGDSDFYSTGLKRLGWQADDLIVNVPFLQAAWAQEHGFGGEGLHIALEQIRRIRPHVVYLQDLSLGTRDLLAAIRPYTRLIVGQIASPLPAQTDLAGFDLIISSFPHFVERFCQSGIAAYYQPLAFDPRVLEKLPDTTRDIPASFVGGISPMHGKGLELLERIAELVPVQFWGYGAAYLRQDSAIVTRHHGEAWGLEMFNLLRRSQITLNRHIDVAENYANNMRLFEATGCGALLITDYKDNLNSLFEVGREVVAYRSPEECAALIAYYLANPHEAEAIARAGQLRTLNDHTYLKRMEQTAEILERHLRTA